MLPVDKHVIAAISIAGCSLDFLGSMYLAYDLLGGRHGPLRTLTRGVTYGVLFGVGYGIPFGAVFGVAGGLSHGVSLSLEYSSAARNEAEPGLLRDAMFSLLRAASFGIGTGWLYGPRFGLMFGILSAAGQIVAYRFGIRPGMDYKPEARPHMTRRQLMSTIVRTLGYGIAGYLSGQFAGRGSRSIGEGFGIGIAVGIVTAIAIGLSPWIEWKAETVPEKKMGTFGIAVILLGFVLQSIQYWVVFWDAPGK